MRRSERILSTMIHYKKPVSRSEFCKMVLRKQRVHAYALLHGSKHQPDIGRVGRLRDVRINVQLSPVCERKAP